MQEHKLHKVSPLFILWENIKKLIFPALIALLGTGGSSSWELYALAGASLVSIISIIQFRFYRYWLEDQQIRVKEGVIFRNLRQVRYDKIQNLNLIQGPLHRIFGVVKVQLESASGGKPEAVINVIDLDAVKELQSRVLAEKQELAIEDPDSEEVDKTNAILSLNFAEIVRYGIISNKGLVVVALFFGFIGQFLDDDNPRNIRPFLKQSINYVTEGVQSIVPEASIYTNILYGIIFVISAILVLWLLSIGMALFKFHDFNLRKRQGKLAATMGLLTRLQATIPMSRIQTLTIHNSWLHQFFKRIGVSIETAGGVNSEQQGVTMKQLAPVLPVEQKMLYLKKVQPDQAWDKIQWSSIETRAWKRVFKVSLIIWTLLLAALNFYSPWVFGSALAVAAIWSFFYAKAYIDNMGYYLSDELVAFKSGVVFRKETYVRLPKVQTVRIKESYFDRRHQMARVELDTAGAQVGAHHIDIPYLDYPAAERIYHRVSRRIRNIEFEW
ncbi:PH domain-containing protein [Kangiella sp. TOML190]|uniref:PH domain-containing protein n=1 Tax=Kangiella sp. TOML190 TaxID=2931351 RepID=UPI00204103F1|nr:PH domain-containing protein [Kangiella sp. TOML190]